MTGDLGPASAAYGDLDDYAGALGGLVAKAASTRPARGHL